jgi:hypothetical protein
MDHTRNAIVLAIRGTLSVSDAITDMNGYEVKFKAVSRFKDCWVHEGIYKNSVNLVEKVCAEKTGKLAAALAAHPTYQLVVVGHSLGAGTCALTSIILGDKYADREVKGYAYAPPNLLEAKIAFDDKVMQDLTSIVYDKDIITRSSVRNMFKLRAQMMQGFATASDSRWDVFKGSLTRRFSLMFDKTLLAAQTAAAANGNNSDAQEHTINLDQITPSYLSNADADAPVSPIETGSVPYMGGRCYQIFPDKDNTSHTIVPVHAQTYQEILCAKSMFLDHMPGNYTLNKIHIPVEFETPNK